MNLGSWKIDDALTFACNTHHPDTGAATDADSVPTYRIYEDETSTPILTGSMALLDGANTTGFYTEQVSLSAANGFEKGKCYTAYIQATVNSIVGTMSHFFQIEAEVDANTVSATVSANVTQIEGSDPTDTIGSSVLNAVAEGTSTLVELIRGIFSTLACKSSGGGTITHTFRNKDDNKNRITATMDSETGNRTAVSFDLT